MSYPIRILPNINYKCITCDVSEFSIIRHTPTSIKEELLEPVTQKVKEGFISSPREHMADLSTNILSVFELEDLKIDLTQLGKDNYSFYCAPNTHVETPVEEEHFKMVENRGYWWVLIKDIHQKQVSFTHADIVYEAECRIIHTPMLWNFWHYSVRWYIHNIGYWHEIADGKLKSKLGSKLGHTSRSFVKMFAKISAPVIQPLDSSSYIVEA